MCKVTVSIHCCTCEIGRLSMFSGVSVLVMCFRVGSWFAIWIRLLTWAASAGQSRSGLHWWRS